MARHRGSSRQANAFGVIVDFAEAVDVVFERLTGKPISVWLKEFGPPTTELPGDKQSISQQETAMSLADAYAVLGLPQTASLKEVERNYKRLAAVFHPDKGGYDEAMKLLNRAYERIRGHGSGSR